MTARSARTVLPMTPTLNNWHSRNHRRPELRNPIPRRTPEEATCDRIRRDYKSLRKGDFANEYGVGALWLNLARRWKRPVQEIKRICRPGASQ